MTPKEELRHWADTLDGIEVHEDQWAVAEEIVADGGYTLGPARGPDRQWKRLAPLGDF